MIIYGVSILAISTVTGLFFGDILGDLIGVKSNVGGVGIAMILLMILSNFPKKVFKISAESSKGIAFWSAMYIPIIVAMAAKQNAVAAIKAGPVALTAGVLAVLISFALIPIMMKLSNNKKSDKS